MEAGAEARLVRVDVADAGEERLIEQQCLERPVRCFHRAAKVAGIDVERLGAEAFVEISMEQRGIGKQSRTAEAARIAKPQLAFVLELIPQVNVVGERLIDAVNRQLPRHSQ